MLKSLYCFLIPSWYGGSELLPRGRCGWHLPPVRSAAGAGSGTGGAHPRESWQRLSRALPKPPAPAACPQVLRGGPRSLWPPPAPAAAAPAGRRPRAGRQRSRRGPPPLPAAPAAPASGPPGGGGEQGGGAGGLAGGAAEPRGGRTSTVACSGGPCQAAGLAGLGLRTVPCFLPAPTLWDTLLSWGCSQRSPPCCPLPLQVLPRLATHVEGAAAAYRSCLELGASSVAEVAGGQLFNASMVLLHTLQPG